MSNVIGGAERSTIEQLIQNKVGKGSELSQATPRRSGTSFRTNCLIFAGTYFY